MFYTSNKPTNPHLIPYVAHYNSIKGNSVNEKSFISLPEGNIGMVFMLGGCSTGYDSKRVSNKRLSHICGLVQEPTLFKASTDIETFSVVFKPGGIFNFIPKHPIDQLAKSSTNLVDIFGDNIFQVEDDLTSCNSFSKRILIVEKFLFRNLQVEDNRIKSAFRFIENSYSSITVSKLSSYLNLGERQLRNIFNHKIGLSPKQFIRLHRFKKSLEYKSALSQNNAQFAMSLGYYDESHFIHDFKEFSGMTPSQYFKNENHISDLSNFNRLMIR